MSQQPFPNQSAFPPPDYSVNYNYWQTQIFSSPPPNFNSLPPNFSRPPPGFFMHPPPRNPPFVQQLTAPNVSQKDQDKEWIKSFLSKRSSLFTVKSRRIPTLKIREVRKQVTSISKNLQRLKKLQELLKQNLNSEENEWNAIVNKIEEIKKDISQAVIHLDGKNEILLRQLLKKRKGKRKAQSHRRAEYQIEKQLRQTNRQSLHLQIDEWMRQQQEEVEREKRDEAIKTEADTVLGEVRLKQTDSRRLLQLLTCLSKLRKLRRQAASDKGLRPSEEDNANFDKVIAKLMAMWESRMKVYGVEEQTLKVMLEKEVVARHGPNKKFNISHDPLQQWERLLFGPVSDVTGTEYVQFTRADFDLQELINIRKQWDEMIVEPGTVMSSVPPVGWVVPTAPSSDDWASLLSKHNQ